MHQTGWCPDGPHNLRGGSRRGSAGLAKYLDFVITQDDYEHTKPHPDPYLTAIARHNLRREECIVVEDSERGLAAATAAGLPCLIVLSEWTKDGDFRSACKVLNSIREVPGAVMNLRDGSVLW